MRLPLEITFRNIERKPDIDQLIHQRAHKLDTICDYINSCRIVIEKLQTNRKSNIPYRVRIDITMPPGHELAVSSDSARDNSRTDLSSEIRWAFDTAERRVKEIMERQRRDVKVHMEQSTQGIVAKLFPLDNSGFIRTLDGRDIYFHRNSVLHHDFEKLRIGTGVRYSEEIGDNGPQASSVQIIDNLSSY